MGIRKTEKILTFALSFYAVMSLVSMAAMSIGFGVVLASLLLIILGPEKNTTWKEPFLLLQNRWVMRIFVIFSALMVVAVFASLLSAALDPLTYANESPVQVNWISDLFKQWYFLQPFVLLPGFFLISDEGRKKVWQSWILAFGLLSLVGIVQYFTGSQFSELLREQPIIGSDPPRFHVILFLGHHLSVSNIWIFPFFFTLDCLWRARKQKSEILPRWLLVACLSVGLVALVLTYSRTLWLALPLGILLWVGLNFRRKWVGIGALIFLVLGAFAVQHPKISEHLKRGNSKESLIQGMVGFRQLIWINQLKIFMDRPVFGVGFRQNQEIGMQRFHADQPVYSFRGHAHNNLIEMLASIGIVGATIWLFWTAAVFVILYRARWVLGSGLFCAYFVYQLNGLTQVNFWEGKVQHQVGWVIAWGLCAWALHVHQKRATSKVGFKSYE